MSDYVCAVGIVLVVIFLYAGAVCTGVKIIEFLTWLVDQPYGPRVLRWSFAALPIVGLALIGVSAL